MKSLDIYLKETAEDGKNGHYQEFVDEDTGEIVSLWVPDPDPEELKKQEEERKKEEQSYWEKREKEEQAFKDLKIDKLEDEVWNYQDQLKDLHREFRDLRIDQEEEVGGLYVQGKEAEAEKLAQEYGEKFNKNADQQELIKKKLIKAKKKLNAARKKMDKIYNELWP